MPEVGGNVKPGTGSAERSAGTRSDGEEGGGTVRDVEVEGSVSCEGMGDADGASRGSTGDATGGATGVDSCAKEAGGSACTGRLRWLLEAGPGRRTECIASVGLCGEVSDRLRLSFRVQSSILMRTCPCSDEWGS